MELGFTYETMINLAPKSKIKKKREVKEGEKIKFKFRRSKIKKDQCAKVYCPWCQCYYQHRIAAQHKRTQKHKNNYLI